MIDKTRPFVGKVFLGPGWATETQEDAALTPLGKTIVRLWTEEDHLYAECEDGTTFECKKKK